MIDIELAKFLGDAIKEAMANGAEASAVATMLMSHLPGLIDRRAAHAGVMVAFDSANRDSDRAMPFGTGPFDRLDPDVL